MHLYLSAGKVGVAGVLVTRMAKPKDSGHVFPASSAAQSQQQQQQAPRRDTFLSRRWSQAKGELHDLAPNLVSEFSLAC